MESPILSICIPTYNQPKELRRLLESISPQWIPEVEILVKDDSTNDESRLIVEEFQSKFPIRYERGLKEGLDRAILYLTENANGKYVWWIGDDVLSKGVIGAVLNVVSDNPDISFVFVNSIEENVGRPDFNLGPSRFLKDKDEAVKLLQGGLGFISATIIEQKRALKSLRDAQKTVGTAWTCLFLVLYVISDGGRLYYLDDPKVETFHRDPAKPVWYDGFTVFAINFSDILTHFKNRFSKGTINYVLGIQVKKIIKGIFVYRAKGYSHGLGSPDPKVRPLLKSYWTFWQFWAMLPLLLVPRFITKPTYLLFRKIFRDKLY